MHPPSALCHAQEAIQRERAANTTLANVREAAERAAAAWNKEAITAASRERRERSRASIARSSEAVQLAEDRHNRALSENPDRGFATSLDG